MSSDLAFHWFLPSAGDSREVGAVIAGAGRTDRSIQRRPTHDYLAQVAVAAETAGFTAVLTPTGSGCEDAWITCSSLIARTSRLQFLVAFRPGFILPTLAAHQAGTFQRLSGNRLRLNIVTGGDPIEQQRFGDFLDHDARYARTDEFLAVLGQAWGDESFEHEGDHYRVSGGGAVLSSALPPVYFGGASPAAERVAARHADVYLAWGEPPVAIAERLDRMEGLASQAGRSLRYGIRIHVISRDTDEEAWAEADRLLAAMSPAQIRTAQDRFARMDSVGQSRMSALNGRGVHRDLEVAPNLWAGIGLVREGAGTALVGSHEAVAERLSEYVDLGVKEFILSGYPHLEEAYRVGEEVVPLLGSRIPASASG